VNSKKPRDTTTTDTSDTSRTLMFFINWASCEELEGKYIYATKAEAEWMNNTFNNVFDFSSTEDDEMSSVFARKREGEVTVDYLKKVALQLQLRGDPNNELSRK